MKSYDELKAEIEIIQQLTVEAKNREQSNTFKEVKRIFRNFGFSSGMLKGSLAESRKKQ